jgi:hypothetical protein
MSEARLHFDCYLWFHNSFPHLRGLLCYNLNNSRNAIQASTDKGLGLQKGRSDMVFYYQGVATMIEFKIETGKQSPDQVKWQGLIEKAGFSYKIIRSIGEFKQLILANVIN